MRGGQNAIRNPPNARQCCNPPQSAIRPAECAKSLQAFEPGTARAQERPQNWAPKLPRGALCAISHAYSESAKANGD
eukprot:11562059-Alexandrium_andersonii.AAC.1